MDLLKAESLAGTLQPVFVGISAESVETARKLHRSHGVISHVFCRRVSLPLRLSVCMRFHVIPEVAKGRLLLQSLQDFAERTENADTLLCLIPASAQYAAFLRRHRDALERHFVLADPAPSPRLRSDGEVTMGKGGRT
ncbi:MAG: hypothetical protein II369_06045 [Clostridia bacterium]|jgi:hypothetical protein|nr:hypothetical protein [Clostridia bacterium]MBQ5833807.1 hypothetical protein [Clostridia bacterium]